MDVIFLQIYQQKYYEKTGIASYTPVNVRDNNLRKALKGRNVNNRGYKPMDISRSYNLQP
ncbi:MAG TPA: hypothetical protein VKA38_05345 [Draconibacterium sp.]|nr:hypothetical protein [Draconibacterium sp.]